MIGKIHDEHRGLDALDVLDPRPIVAETQENTKPNASDERGDPIAPRNPFWNLKPTRYPTAITSRTRTRFVPRSEVVRPASTAERAIGSERNRSIKPCLQVLGQADRRSWSNRRSRSARRCPASGSRRSGCRPRSWMAPPNTNRNSSTNMIGWIDREHEQLSGCATILQQVALAHHDHAVAERANRTPLERSSIASRWPVRASRRAPCSVRPRRPSSLGSPSSARVAGERQEHVVERRAVQGDVGRG